MLIAGGLGATHSLYELNAQLHADLPTQELQENLDSAFSIRRILNDRNQAVKGTPTDLHLLSRPELGT
jgi:hypothetical protein